MAKVSVACGEAYVEWLAARAAAAKQKIDIHGSEPLPKTQTNRSTALDRIKAAEHRLIQAPVTIGWQLLQKFEVLQNDRAQARREAGRWPPPDDAVELPPRLDAVQVLWGG